MKPAIAQKPHQGTNSRALTEITPTLSTAPKVFDSNAGRVSVSNVRFWSMVSIVAVHSFYACGLNGPGKVGALQILLVQLVKFGTIGFFLISGFLLGERLDRGPRCDYLNRRFNSTALPWAFWAAIYFLMTLAPALSESYFGPAPHGRLAQLYVHLKEVVFHSPYWFVPNFLLCLSLLLLFRRFLASPIFGLLLLASSLFYGINIYEHWISTAHTAALLGFVFYQWLGVWAAQHPRLVSIFVIGFEWKFLLPAVAVSALLAVTEVHFMMSRFSFSPLESLNTLRISNQLFSLLVVVGLWKISKPIWPFFVDVRKQTYGIFLIHPILLLLLSHATGLINLVPTKTSNLLMLGSPILLFISVYGCSLAATGLLSKSIWMHWTVSSSGARSRKLENVGWQSTTARVRELFGLSAPA